MTPEKTEIMNGKNGYSKMIFVQLTKDKLLHNLLSNILVLLIWKSRPLSRNFDFYLNHLKEESLTYFNRE